MKRLLFVGLTALVASFIVGISYAEEEIYWDRSTPPDDTISRQDFKFKYGSSQSKSLAELEIYDTYPSRGEEMEPVEPEVISPVRPRGADVRRPAEISPRPTRVSPRPSAVSPRSLDVLPQPEETSPGSRRPALGPREMPPGIPTPDGETRRGTPVPASAEETDKPAGKKMQWGQVDVKPAEPKSEADSEPKTKFRWGQ